MKKLTIELDDNTFAWLEVLAVGLAKENESVSDYQAAIEHMTRKQHDDFGAGISQLLTSVAGSLATGVKRSGSWERETLSSLTGYQGTYVRSMFDKCIEEEAVKRGFNVAEKSQ
jgi:hypothetical protein